MKLPHHTARTGEMFFVLLLLLAALFLLSQIGAETRFSARGKLFAQPRFWPAVGVIGMVLFGAGHLLVRWRMRAGGLLSQELFVWVRALEYLVWFMLYVRAVPLIGYLLATILFTVLLSLRQGYRGGRELIKAAALALAIVLVFKTFLSVKIPGGQIYEHLPDALRNFMIVNF